MEKKIFLLPSKPYRDFESFLHHHYHEWSMMMILVILLHWLLFSSSWMIFKFESISNTGKADRKDKRGIKNRGREWCYIRGKWRILSDPRDESKWWNPPAFDSSPESFFLSLCYDVIDPWDLFPTSLFFKHTTHGYLTEPILKKSKSLPKFLSLPFHSSDFAIPPKNGFNVWTLILPDALVPKRRGQWCPSDTDDITTFHLRPDPNDVRHHDFLLFFFACLTSSSTLFIFPILSSSVNHDMVA